MSRGRLINPFTIRLYRLDTTQTANDPDGSGVLTSGLHPTFKEPRKLSLSGKPAGVGARVEFPPLDLPAQVEVVELAKMQQMFAGNTPGMAVVCVFHYRDLELFNLLDSVSGEARLWSTTRLGEVLDPRTGALVQVLPNPPGLYATRVESEFGGLGRRRNLLIATFTDRPQAAEGPR